MNHHPISILGMEGDLPFQFTNFLFLIPPVLKAIWDVVFHEKLQIPVVHRQSLAYAITIGLLLTIVDWHFSPVSWWLQSAFLCLTTFWLVFDYFRNWLAGKNLLYMDIKDTDPGVEDSWVDINIYSRFPSAIMWLWVKFWMWVLSFLIYYFFGYI